MDPLGLGLENFDGIGAFRTTEAGKPIRRQRRSGRCRVRRPARSRGRPQKPQGYGGLHSPSTFTGTRPHLEGAGEDPAMASLAKGFQDNGYQFRALLEGCRQEPGIRPGGQGAITPPHQPGRRYGMLSKSVDRNVLRGVVGGAAVSVGLPPLEAMFNANGTAHADGTALPRRLASSSGATASRRTAGIRPPTGANWPISPELETADAGQGLHHGGLRHEGDDPAQQGTHTGAVGILFRQSIDEQAASGAPFRSTFSTPSVDQVAAAVIGKTTKFKSLEVGLSTKVNTREGTSLQYLSHNGPDNPNPSEYQPAKLFERVFGAGFTPPAGKRDADSSTSPRRSAAASSTPSWWTSTPSRAAPARATKMRLDQHLENIRGIEKRLENDTTLPPPFARRRQCPTLLPRGGR